MDDGVQGAGSDPVEESGVMDGIVGINGGHDLGGWRWRLKRMCWLVEHWSHGRCFVVVDAFPKKDILWHASGFDRLCTRGTQRIGLRRPDDLSPNDFSSNGIIGTVLFPQRRCISS